MTAKPNRPYGRHVKVKSTSGDEPPFDLGVSEIVELFTVSRFP